MKRIVIADDHRLVLDGLISCFQSMPDVEVVGTATDGEELLALVERLEPDLALVDISMPGMNGIEACRRIVADSRGAVKVAILTMHQDREFVNAAFQAGAAGFIVKSSAFSELGIAVETIGAGRFYVSPVLSEHYVRDVVNGAGAGSSSPVGRLTPREREVFKLLAEGLSVKEISYRLEISHKTVHAHRAMIMRKLEVSSMAELTKLAIRHGITSVD